MATALNRDIRRLLDRAVRKARIVAEDGARKALAEIGLEGAKRPEGLPPAQTELRNRLRAHARSLGDVMQVDGTIRANRLVREIAYVHWHRALFARFLAESNLLIDPEHKVAVSLDLLEQVAKEEGRDVVEMAGDWAEPMLPQIFGKDDPVLALALPPETTAGIAEIVKGLPGAVFAADDSLGWVYQFWQADQKDRVNESEVKIGADELPAVTQLFTEDYMVLFLLENTLGAWWAGKALAADPALAAEAESEEELREKTSPPGYRWTYLRFVRQSLDGETQEAATGPWRPAAGSFDRWPKAAKDITVLDPCMGSGHFLVFALPILVAFRRSEEGLDERAAVKAVLADNLFGLEIDPRCTQIAAFALALASWKRLGGPEPLPRVNLACSGIAIGLGKAEFLKLAEKVAAKRGWRPTTDLLGDGATPIEGAVVKREREGLSRLYDLFEQAPHLGSLIDPRRAGADLFASGFDELTLLLNAVLEAGETTPEVREVAVTAQGLAKAADILIGKFTLVTTNVPFLGNRKQNVRLIEYAKRFFKSSKTDLSVTMLDRLLRSEQIETIASISPQAWLQQTSYRSFLKEVVFPRRIHIVVRYGAGAFETVSGEVVSVSATIISGAKAKNGFVPALDLSHHADYENKDLRSRDAGISRVRFTRMEEKEIFLFEETHDAAVLGTLAFGTQGVKTGDDERFVIKFWERNELCSPWRPYLGTTDSISLYPGRNSLLRWEQNGSDLVRSRKDNSAYDRIGVAINQMGQPHAFIYTGEAFDSNIAPIISHSPADNLALLVFLQSAEFLTELRKIEKGMKVNNGTILRVPFDRSQWHRTATERFPNGLPKPFSNDPAQWLFDGHPRGSADPNVAPDSAANPRLVTPHGVRPGLSEHPLQVAVARLLGYRWPRQTGSSFMHCPAIAEPDEVDCAGLADADGIVPLPPLAGETDAATRLRELIRAVWGPDYGEDTIRDLLAAEAAGARDLSTWVADEFFDGHCRLFHQTPFVWHVWDGARGGFSALVNYHRLCYDDGAGRRLLEKLRDTYLGEWIASQRRAVTAGEAGAEERLLAAEHLRSELTKIIDGDPPYDIFVRWKPLHHQPVGWEPDIDDGVRLNIRPFLIAKPRNPGRQDACILRVTPRVGKYAGADRGAEPKREREDFPWFFAEDSDVATPDFTGGPAFKGRRYNDFHYTRAFKQRAHDARSKKS